MSRYPDNDFDFSTLKDDAVGFAIIGVTVVIIILGLCATIAAVRPM